MDKERKVPRIRFPGFTDDWEQRKFSDGVSEVGDGLHGTPTYSDDGDVYFVNGNNLVDGNIVINSETKTVDENQRSVADKSLDDNTILMSINGTIGNLAYYLGEKLMLGKSAAYIKVSEFDKKFVYAYLQAPSVQAYFMDSLTGTTIKNLGLKAIREMRIIVPQNIEEQNKIGEYFSNLDNLITLHQRKSESLSEYKKGMLQKMFPKDGKNVPEIRFPGFTDDWEQRKFGDIAIRESLSQESSDDYPFVEYEDVVAEEGRLNKDIRQKEGSKKGIVFDGSQVLYGKLRPYLHNWLNPDFSGVAVGDWWVLKPQNTDKNFVYRLIQTQLFDDVANQSAGSKMPRADWNLVSNTEFAIPTSHDEQEKIGEYFSNLDNLITLHQRKSEELREYKKGLLQQMFV